jgi:hypothetical protein
LRDFSFLYAAFVLKIFRTFKHHRNSSARGISIYSKEFYFSSVEERRMGKQEKKTVTGRVLHDPVKDKLRPIFPLDLSRCRTIDDLVRAMAIPHSPGARSAMRPMCWKRWRAIKTVSW